MTSAPPRGPAPGAQLGRLAVELLEPRARVRRGRASSPRPRPARRSPGRHPARSRAARRPTRSARMLDHARASRAGRRRGGSSSRRWAAAPCAARPRRAARSRRRCPRAAGPRTAAARWIDRACRYSSSRASVTSCASMSASTARSRSLKRASVSSACCPFCWRTSTTMAFSVLNRKCGCSCAFNAPSRACATCVSSCEARRSERSAACARSWKRA